MYNPEIKKRNQSIYDYILTNYGTLEYLYKFISDNNITDFDTDFYDYSTKTFIIDKTIKNLVLNSYRKNQKYIETYKK